MKFSIGDSVILTRKQDGQDITLPGTIVLYDKDSAKYRIDLGIPYETYLQKRHKVIPPVFLRNYFIGQSGGNAALWCVGRVLSPGTPYSDGLENWI